MFENTPNANLGFTWVHLFLECLAFEIEQSNVSSREYCPGVRCRTLCGSETPRRTCWSRRLSRPSPTPLSSTWIQASSTPTVASPIRTCTTTCTWPRRATRLCASRCTPTSSPCSINQLRTEGSNLHYHSGPHAWSQRAQPQLFHTLDDGLNQLLRAKICAQYLC